MINGESVKDTVKLVMNRLFNNHVMSFLSLDGRSYGKMAFRNTPLCQVVAGKSHGSTVCIHHLQFACYTAYT